ncbi:hypothetical protein [Nocardia heshunensis]
MSSYSGLRAGRTAAATLLAVTAVGTLTATTFAYVDVHGGGSGGVATPSEGPAATVAPDGTAANATPAPAPVLSPGHGRTHARSSGS